MVYPTEATFKKIIHNMKCFKYLEGAQAIYQCFAAGPPSLGVCDPSQNHPVQVLSSAAYQPRKGDASKKS